jgi:predicted nucleic acid-binding protein
MNPVYADAGYWIALLNPRDQLHLKATAVSRTLLGREIVTSQMVLTEFLNHYAALGQPFRQRAAQVVRNLEESTEVRIVPQSEEQFAAALDLYEKRLDKDWGLTDCASFTIMQGLGVTEALAHDDHFQQAGFVPLLK